MKLQHSSPAGLKTFTACGTGYVMVGNARYERPIVVTPQQVLNDWPPQNFGALNEAHFEYFLTLRPEILLLGTGDRQYFPHPQLYRMLTAAGIAVECMTTPAACRTYNILVAEDRQVVAGILL